LAVQARNVSEEESGLRLDRWFRRHFPNLTHARLEKLLRTGQIRVDGQRAKAGHRLESGQKIRVPPISAGEAAKPAAPSVSRADAAWLHSLVLYEDAEIIALNKPAGLAVQGGTKTAKHLDALLDGLRVKGGERPRLVHRLDRDTSGVLLLARTAAAARDLGAAFKTHQIEKIYWGLVAGVPRVIEGMITAPLAKRGAVGAERMMAVDERDDASRARTRFRLIDRAGNRVAWLALAPETGRTHQLRVHCTVLGTPVVGDGKYGGAGAFIEGLAKKVHLHARRLKLPRPGRKPLIVEAPLPEHMAASWRALGFDEKNPLATEEFP